MKKVSSVLSTALLVILVAAVVAVAVPRFFGIKIYTVLSGSMEPKLSAGDLIYVLPTDPEKIDKNDVISFVADKNLLVVTHRVVEVNREKKLFTTKGDANNAPDASPVIYGNVIGVVKFSLPFAGYIFTFLSTAPGMIIAVTVALSIMLIAFLLGKVKKEPAEDGD